MKTLALLATVTAIGVTVHAGSVKVRNYSGAMCMAQDLQIPDGHEVTVHDPNGTWIFNLHSTNVSETVAGDYQMDVTQNGYTFQPVVSATNWLAKGFSAAAITALIAWGVRLIRVIAKPTADHL